MAQYPNDFIDRLHLVWGTGFLSPGGPEEVGQIVRGIDMNDALERTPINPYHIRRP